jgi:hypothetical protein
MRTEILHTGRDSIDPDTERQVPRLRLPARPFPDVELERGSLESRRGQVGPGDRERHLVRRMDPGTGDRDERDEVVLGREPELESADSEAKIEERPYRVGHGPGIIDR